MKWDNDMSLKTWYKEFEFKEKDSSLILDFNYLIMKKIFIVVLYMLNYSLSFAQSLCDYKIATDSICVTFNKVKPSFDNWSTAQLNASYQDNTNNVVLTFEVPNFIDRFKTTLSDYCIIETESKQYKLINQKEVFLKETLNYTFTFVVQKDDLLEIVKNNLKKITFYFVPNEQFIKERLENDKFMGEELKRHLVRLSRKTIKYEVSNPNQAQYSALKSWLKIN